MPPRPAGVGSPEMSDPGPQGDNRRLLGELFAADQLARSLSVSLLDWGGGWATAAATPGPKVMNFLGSVHGGYIFAATDVALSVASNSWGRVAVAISVDFHYVAPAPSNEQLEFTAQETSRGRNIATYALEVRSDQRLIATATGTTFRTKDWHLGEHSWSAQWRAHH